MGTGADIVDSQIKEYVQQAVGSSSTSLVDDIVDKVKEIGIEKPSDFQYMDESDLDCLGLKKIQLRKLLKSWEEGKSSDGLSASSSSVSPCSSILSLPDSSPEGTCWSSSYQIPWKRMPKGLQNSIHRKERPLPSERRQMIRLLADDIVKITSHPMRKHLAVVASKVVAEYPYSFQDKLDDVIVDNGYNSILTQLEQRFQNLNRQLKPMKRGNSSSDETGSSQGAKRQRASCSYGTNSEQFSPEIPNAESQDEKRRGLQEMHTREVWKLDTVTEILTDTYPTVRHVINGGTQSVLSIKEDWPFLFEEVGMLHHFEILVGIKLKETLASAFTSKVPRLLQFLDSKQSTNKQLKLKLHELSCAKRQASNTNPEIIGLLGLLSTFFGENTMALVQSVEETSLEADIDRAALPVTPCIIALGPSPVTSVNFMLAIDREVVNSHMSSPMEALCMLFASYFVCNIEYTKEAAATFEFIQRCLVGINPKTGSKVKKTWRGSIHPKVLSLINGLKDFESDWSN